MDLSLTELATNTGQALKQCGLKLAVAESCTGGGLGYWLTTVSGSSEWFERGFITYSNQAKIDMLGVNPNTIAKHGAVSEATAREMADGALRSSHADISIAITGIAGPDGGTPQKPVGTVWMAWARRKMPTQTQMMIFTGNREEIRSHAIAHVLEKLLAILAPTSKA